MIKSKIACSGSGSWYITGFIDANYKENMSLEEAKKFVLTGINFKKYFFFRCVNRFLKKTFFSCFFGY